MRQRILILFLITLLGVLGAQGMGLFSGIQEVSAIDSDYYSPFDVAYSPDGTMIAVSDLTKARLNIITASTGSIARTVQLVGKPKGVAWNGNTRVYVAEYGEGTVAEIDPTSGSILRRFETGRMPVGLAVASNKLVVTDYGCKQVTVVDLTTGSTLGSASVKDYPYFVDMTTNGTYAVVGHAIPSGNAWNTGYAATVSFVDVNTRTVATNLTLPMGSSNVRDIECSPDGNWVYVVHTLGRVTLPTTQITKGWVNTDALTIINASTRSIYTTVLLDTLYEGAADPWGLAISSDSRTLWVSVSGTHQVYKLDLYNLHQLLNGNVPTRSGAGDPTLTFRSKSGYSKPYSDIWFAIKADGNKRALLKNNLGALYSAGLVTRIKLAGQGPRGITISPDGTRVAVGAYFAGQIYLINTSTNQSVQTISLGNQPAEDSARRGERTFHDASTTTQKWLSCATCHPEGRADGLNWDMPNDGIGTPKNTKSMYKIFETPPVMWRGVRADAPTGINAGFKFIKFKTPTQQELDDVGNYIKSIPEENSPYCNPDGSLTADAVAGKTLFESAATQCATCHSGPNLTDLAIHDVGTKDPYDIDGNYVSPPLIELWRTAPYLHDGSAPTLRDVLTTKNTGNRHGSTTQLTSTQIDQLVAYMLQVRAGGNGPTPTPNRNATPTLTLTQVPTPTPTVGVNTPTPTPTQVPGTVSIACGSSSAVGSFQADQYYSGGSAYSNTNTVDVSQITSNPPPSALFNNERYGAMSYTIPGFVAGSSYTVTLYFAETYLTSAGSRIFNVFINGSPVLSNFDIYAAAGGQNKAIARPFTATADSSGQFVIQFTAGTENPKINGISIKPGGSTPTATPTGTVNTPTPTPTSRPTPTATVTTTQAPTPTPTTGTYVKFRNVATGLYIDGMGSTSNGANACQYASSTSNNQQWTLEAVGSYYKIKNRATGLYLDGAGRTSNGSICGQWSSSSSTNQQWVQETVGSYFKYKNVATGLYLDGMGSTSNGSNLCQYSSSGSTNQQWQKQ